VKKIHFALRIFITATNNANGIVLIRPRLVADIARQFQIVEAMPIESKKQKEINSTEAIVQFYEAVMSQNRQIPVLVIIKEPNENLFPILFQTQLDVERQSILTLAHVIALPEKLLDAWNLRIGETLAIPKNGVRLYYPNVMADGETSIRHPSWTADDVNSWKWNDQQGIPAFAIFLKGILAEYAAMKPMNWGSCLFYPKMRERLSELRREQLAKSQFESDYIVTLEEDNAVQKKTIDEQELEIETLKEERFKLKQEKDGLQIRLDCAYRPKKISDSESSSVKVKIRKKAKEELETIYGDAGNTLRTMIQHCENKDWRKSHWDPWEKSNLTVLKSAGKSMTRLAGYEQNGIFYIAFVFDDHNNYEHTLESKHSQKEHVHHSVDEYVDVY
jgi:hypothetical protein